VQITSFSFRYFESIYKAHGGYNQSSYHGGPLFSVPLESIDCAVKINKEDVELQNNRNLR
jgi:hypothetical protein